MKLKDIFTLHTKSVTPTADKKYHLYSLPAFDNNKKREEVGGTEILSNKFSVPNKCILFNKLNVRFKRVWVVNNEDENKLASTEFFPLVVKEDKVDFLYAYYLLTSDFVTNFLSEQHSNTSQSHKRIDSDLLFSIDVELPPVKVQKTIGKFLNDLDSKIALNRKINRNLEAMAKQLYDYWFVQFDFPNEEGKPYKSSGGAMVWNEKLKREIPKEWNVANVFDELSVQYGFPFSTELFTEEPTDIPIVRIRDILENSVSAYSEEEVDEKYKLQKQDLVIGMDGNFHMNYWNDNVSYLNQRSVRLRTKSKSTVSIMQAKYDIAPYIKAKELRAKGSTVGHLSDKDLKELFVLVSPNADFRNKFDSILAEIIENRCEIIELTKQRDELLPLLMNGQATVNCDLSHD